MTTPGSKALVSQPIGPGSDSHGFGWKSVLVRSIDTNRRIAVCVDDFGKTMDVRCDILRSKGNLPEAGEQWLIDRQYGIWMFGAIINGTTRGIEVANVTDLPEALGDIGTTIQGNATAAATADAAQTAATTALTAATTGKISAKGDILAGSGVGIVVRQPAGADGAVPVYDSTSVTGLTPKVPLALTAPITGATAAGRYVGQTSTAAAPTTGGPFLVGDWIRDVNGLVWVCTVAGSPGTWASGASTRLTAVESTASTNATTISSHTTSITNIQASGKHIWTSSARPLSGAGGDVVLTTWTQYFSDGLATLNGSGLFQFNQPGKWAMTFMCGSDCTVTGSMLWYIAAGSPNPFGAANNTILRTRAARAAGFANSGRIDQNICWTGRVAAADAAQAFAVHASWQASDNATNATLNYSMALEYLGAA